MENARLFDETKRLLTETDERAAELAIISEGAARAWPSSLDMQAMYDVVGQRAPEPSSTRRSSTLAIPRRDDGLPALSRRRRARRALSAIQPIPVMGIREHVMRHPPRPLLVNEEVVAFPQPR